MAAPLNPPSVEPLLESGGKKTATSSQKHLKMQCSQTNGQFATKGPSCNSHLTCFTSLKVGFIVLVFNCIFIFKNFSNLNIWNKKIFLVFVKFFLDIMVTWPLEAFAHVPNRLWTHHWFCVCTVLSLSGSEYQDTRLSVQDSSQLPDSADNRNIFRRLEQHLGVPPQVITHQAFLGLTCTHCWPRLPYSYIILELLLGFTGLRWTSEHFNPTDVFPWLQLLYSISDPLWTITLL